ncbi:alpha/beta hydrolase [Nocardia sp. NBC_01499]|uniref:alpha/beta hydrolase n=1 Tax=Nocardia sp. NBC_01499 TaxID=2903597 RepID=UPI0038688771
MPLDPAIDGLIKQLAAVPPPARELTIAEKRARNALLALAMSPNPPLQVNSIGDDNLAGVPVRVYRPKTTGRVPTVAYFHGGAFVYGDLDTHDQIGRRLCRDLGAVVVSVGYRLAPEHLYPAAHDDCLTVTRWIADHIDEYGGGNLAVAGDSSGANLAAGVALGFRDEGRPLAAQLLAYPNLDLSHRFNYPSYSVYVTGDVMSPGEAADFAEIYLASDATACDHAPASPLLAKDFTGLAAAVIATAEFDPVHDECLAYARALTSAGVPVTTLVYPGLIHGFLSLEAVSPAAAGAVSEVYGEFAELLNARVVQDNPRERSAVA